MLQWMGGSRRKVTTSRKSTQKRQKQYFDQRRRQHQIQQTVGESFTDGPNPFPHQNNNRSLDILSLLNLSTVVENYNSSSYSTREGLEGGGVLLDCHTSKGQPIIQTAKATLNDPAEFKVGEAEYPSSCQVETVYPTKVLSGDHDIQTRDLIANDERRGKLNLGNEHRCGAESKCEKWVPPKGQRIEPIGGGDRRNKLKTASGQQLSVFDLLGDDGSNGNDEEKSSCEAHVAFAMEGLGEMGTETPVHSPEQPVRIFSYGSVSPVKAQRQSHFSKNLNDLLYDLELKAAAVTQNTDLPLYGSFLETPLFSEGTCNPFNNAEDMSTCNKPWQFLNNDGKSKNSFADDEMIWEIDNGTEDNWNGPHEECYTSWKNSPLKRDGFSADPRDECYTSWKNSPLKRDDFSADPNEECYTSWKNSSLKRDDFSADRWNIGLQRASDFTSMGPVHKIRVAEKSRKFSIAESADPYYKQSRVEKDADLRASTDEMCRSPKVGHHSGTSYVTSQPAWPSYLTEDVGDSLSLRSEESCSSSAVRGKTIKTRPSSSLASQKKEWYGIDTRNPLKEDSIEKMYTTKDYEQLVDLCEVKKVYDRRKCSEKCKASITNTADGTNKIFNKRFRPQDNFLFDEVFDYVNMAPGFSPSLEAKTHASPDRDIWNENLFGACSSPQSQGKMESTFERFEHGLSPCGGFPLEEHPSYQPSSHLYSYETPIFATHGSGLSKPDICIDTEVDIPQYSSHLAGGWREAKEGTLGNCEDKETEPETTNSVTLELQKDACIGSNDLSSEDERPSETSDTSDSSGTSRRLKELIPEMENLIEPNSLVCLNEKPSSLKIIKKSGYE